MMMNEVDIRSYALRIRELELQETVAARGIALDRSNNKLEYFNHPNPPQEELLNAWLLYYLKVFTFTGANRIGKTTIGSIIAISTAIGEYLWDGTRLRFPHRKPRKIRYIGQDWEKHIQAVVIPALEEWWPKNREVIKKKNNQGIEALWTDVKTGSSIEIMSNKQDSELHEGWEGDLIVYDEPPKRKIRIANARGLVDRQGRELFCMTLLKEAWVDREVIKALNDDGTPDETVFNIHGDIWDNMGYGLTEAGINQFAKTLNDDEKEARLKGVPSYMSGLVCPQYKRGVHLVKRFTVPLDWPVTIAIDIHPSKPQAILFKAVSPTNQHYLVEEVWENGDGTWVGEEIIRRINRNSYRVDDIIVDPLAKGDKNNRNTTFDKIRNVLNRYGYSLRTASKDKDSGIIQINALLKTPNNEAALFIFKDLIRTLYEIEGWMYDAVTHKPQKEDDDMMENLYRLMLLDTRYSEMDDYDEEDDDNKPSRNSHTGY